MKDLIVKNIADIEGMLRERDGNEFTVKPVVAGEDVDTCSVAFVEVPVGKYAFGYHFHDQSEEVFYIVSGTGKLRCFYGEKDVKAGDMLCFPTGEKGAHLVSNTSDSEPLIFIDFDVNATRFDIVTSPDTNTIRVNGTHIQEMFELPQKKDE